MSQSGFIVAALLAGFVLWLAVQGRLTTYSHILWSKAPAPAPAQSGGGSGGFSVSDGVKLGLDIATGGVSGMLGF